jgi:hypothetical protein
MLASSLGLNRFDIKKQLGQGSFSKCYMGAGVGGASAAAREERKTRRHNILGTRQGAQ